MTHEHVRSLHLTQQTGGQDWVNSHIVVHLNFGKQGHVLGIETESKVSTAVTTATLDTLPFFNPRHHDINQLPEEMLHILSTEIRLDRNGISTGCNTPGSHTSLGLVRLDTHVRDSLHCHTGDMQPRRVFLCSLLHVTVYRDPLDLWDVVEVDGLAQ